MASRALTALRNGAFLKPADCPGSPSPIDGASYAQAHYNEESWGLTAHTRPLLVLVNTDCTKDHQASVEPLIGSDSGGFDPGKSHCFGEQTVPQSSRESCSFMAGEIMHHADACDHMGSSKPSQRDTDHGHSFLQGLLTMSEPDFSPGEQAPQQVEEDEGFDQEQREELPDPADDEEMPDQAAEEPEEPRGGPEARSRSRPTHAIRGRMRQRLGLQDWRHYSDGSDRKHRGGRRVKEAKARRAEQARASTTSGARPSEPAYLRQPVQQVQQPPEERGPRDDEARGHGTHRVHRGRVRSEGVAPSTAPDRRPGEHPERASRSTRPSSANDRLQGESSGRAGLGGPQAGTRAPPQHQAKHGTRGSSCS
eukprot:5407290-Amphidinium_carterae.2